MKTIFIAAALLISAAKTWAQDGAPLYTRSAYLESKPLALSYRKTTSLIFPAAIKSVDRGSADIIVQKTEGVENVLKLKAGLHRFEETNLSVITADGNFYAFNVVYRDDPQSYTVLVRPMQATGNAATKAPAKAVFSEHMTNETRLRKLAAQASISAKNIRNVADKSYGIEVSLTGLYIADDKFFYKLMLHNTTNIAYDVAAINFYIRDRKKVRRMATQEISLEPLLVIGNHEQVGANASRMLIVALPKQTIASGKRLVFGIEEANGGRNLECSLKNSILLKADPIRVTDAVDNIPNVLTAGK